MRTSSLKRETAETSVSLELNIDGTGTGAIDTGIGFFDHMLTLFCRHGGFDLTLTCRGDLAVDGHHSVEDVGICLGSAFLEAAGDKRGIRRYGDIILPMDEALILCAADVSGRSWLSYSADIPAPSVGDFDTELVREFFTAFCSNARITLHIKQLDGFNSHHIIEGMFKAFGRALGEALSIDEARKNDVPSTKGIL